ncbi:MAG: four helix bundle protein [Vicinamibacterales bacterium]
MQDFRKLEAWQKAHAITLRTYAVTELFPKAELFGLTSQMRRAAVSIPANIAEGCYRGQRSLAHSLRIALGSAGELEYFIILAGDLTLLPDVDSNVLAKQVSDVKAVLTGLLKSVNASIERR